MGGSIRGEINQDVVNTLVELMRKTIGEGGISVILKRLGEHGELSGRALVIACAEEMELLFGAQGAYAILRQVGRELSDRLAAMAPKEEYQEILAGSLNNLGFAQGIEVADNHANICNCVFYDQIIERNRSPIEHPVCWAGWGFIEGFMNKINGTHHVEWAGRDIKANACRFNFYSSLTELRQ